MGFFSFQEVYTHTNKHTLIRTSTKQEEAIFPFPSSYHFLDTKQILIIALGALLPLVV